MTNRKLFKLQTKLAMLQQVVITCNQVYNMAGTKYEPGSITYTDMAYREAMFGILQITNEINGTELN